MMQANWRDVPIVSFDLEATGAYPIGSEICEIAAVKWFQGQIVDEFQTLIRPRQIMSDFIIGIHKITNEMVETAPRIEEKVADFHRFIAGSMTVAHHAPFDLGFMVYEFERKGLPLPQTPALCTSLLSLVLMPQTENHRLQTLVKHLKIEGGQAHRALDDSKNCLAVLLHCLKVAEETLSPNSPLTVEKIGALMGGVLKWPRYSIEELTSKSTQIALAVEATQKGREIKMIYGKSKDSFLRTVKPLGVVRSLQGDYLGAMDPAETKPKRFYLERIQHVEII